MLSITEDKREAENGRDFFGYAVHAYRDSSSEGQTTVRGGTTSQYVSVDKEAEHTHIQVYMCRKGIVNINVDTSGDVISVDVATSTSGCYEVGLLHPHDYENDSGYVLDAKQALDDKYSLAMVKYSQQHGVTGGLTFDTSEDARSWMEEQGLSTDKYQVRYVYPPDDFFEGENGRLNFARLKKKGYK